MTVHADCPICGGATRRLDSVDFNKSCEEVRGRFLPPAGQKVEYDVCEQCGFCFAPQLCQWSLDEFAERIYNSEYVRVDPDYADARPRANAGLLQAMLDGDVLELRHLDYGGGNGLLSELMRGAGWQSASYDPFADRDIDLREFGRFDLVTAFEVFEHVPDPVRLVEELVSMLDVDGVIFFSTLLSDGSLRSGQKLDWWYASPRNGHISLYSSASLSRLGAKHGLNFGSFSTAFHAYWRRIPAWAGKLIRSD
ncbi:MAG: class I SAM-dependent methyltransferase [Burkholderiales bacterium]